MSAAARGGTKIIQKLTLKQAKPKVPVEKPISIHDEIKNKLVQVGKLQGFIAESEYDMDGGKLDVVWRKVEKGSPTCF